jgi:hypothetical protein
MKWEKAAWLVEQFEKGSLPKEQWTHSAHFVVAFWYCTQYPLPQAIKKITTGIKAYNVASGGQNTEDSGYHETITLFYITVISGYLVTEEVSALTDEALAVFLQQSFLAKDFIYLFYSVPLLKSKQARQGWVAPDKNNSPFWRERS